MHPHSRILPNAAAVRLKQPIACECEGDSGGRNAAVISSHRNGSPKGVSASVRRQQCALLPHALALLFFLSNFLVTPSFKPTGTYRIHSLDCVTAGDSLKAGPSLNFYLVMLASAECAREDTKTTATTLPPASPAARALPASTLITTRTAAVASPLEVGLSPQKIPRAATSSSGAAGQLASEASAGPAEIAVSAIASGQFLPTEVNTAQVAASNRSAATAAPLKTASPVAVALPVRALSKRTAAVVIPAASQIAQVAAAGTKANVLSSSIHTSLLETSVGASPVTADDKISLVTAGGDYGSHAENIDSQSAQTRAALEKSSAAACRPSVLSSSCSKTTGPCKRELSGKLSVDVAKQVMPAAPKHLLQAYSPQQDIRNRQEISFNPQQKQARRLFPWLFHEFTPDGRKTTAGVSAPRRHPDNSDTPPPLLSAYTYKEVLDELQQLQARFPHLLHVSNYAGETGLSSSMQHHECQDGLHCEIPLAELTNFSTKTEATPTLFFSGAVHGDERAGPTAAVELLRYLCERFEKDSEVYYLLNNRRLLVMPFPNAVGFAWRTREEMRIDVNRDFPYDQQPDKCFRSVASRAVNEVFRRNIILAGISWHGGMKSIAYPWGSFNHAVQAGNHWLSRASPDGAAFLSIAQAMQTAGGRSMTGSEWYYPVGDMTNLVYPVHGGMEDWAYGIGFESSPSPISICQPPTSSLPELLLSHNISEKNFLFPHGGNTKKSSLLKKERQSRFPSRSLSSPLKEEEKSQQQKFESGDGVSRHPEVDGRNDEELFSPGGHEVSLVGKQEQLVSSSAYNLRTLPQQRGQGKNLHQDSSKIHFSQQRKEHGDGKDIEGDRDEEEDRDKEDRTNKDRGRMLGFKYISEGHDGYEKRGNISETPGRVHQRRLYNTREEEGYRHEEEEEGDLELLLDEMRKKNSLRHEEEVLEDDVMDLLEDPTTSPQDEDEFLEPDEEYAEFVKGRPSFIERRIKEDKVGHPRRASLYTSHQDYHPQRRLPWTLFKKTNTNSTRKERDEQLLASLLTMNDADIPTALGERKNETDNTEEEEEEKEKDITKRKTKDKRGLKTEGGKQEEKEEEEERTSLVLRTSYPPNRSVYGTGDGRTLLILLEMHDDKHPSPHVLGPRPVDVQGLLLPEERMLLSPLSHLLKPEEQGGESNLGGRGNAEVWQQKTESLILRNVRAAFKLIEKVRPALSFTSLPPLYHPQGAVSLIGFYPVGCQTLSFAQLQIRQGQCSSFFTKRVSSSSSSSPSSSFSSSSSTAPDVNGFSRVGEDELPARDTRKKSQSPEILEVVGVVNAEDVNLSDRETRLSNTKKKGNEDQTATSSSPDISTSASTATSTPRGEEKEEEEEKDGIERMTTHNHNDDDIYDSETYKLDMSKWEDAPLLVQEGVKEVPFVCREMGEWHRVRNDHTPPDRPPRANEWWGEGGNKDIDTNKGSQEDKRGRLEIQYKIPPDASNGEYCALVFASFDQAWGDTSAADPELPPQAHVSRLRLEDNYEAQSSDGNSIIRGNRIWPFPMSVPALYPVVFSGGLPVFVRDDNVEGCAEVRLFLPLLNEEEKNPQEKKNSQGKTLPLGKEGLFSSNSPSKIHPVEVFIHLGGNYSEKRLRLDPFAEISRFPGEKNEKMTIDRTDISVRISQPHWMIADGLFEIRILIEGNLITHALQQFLHPISSSFSSSSPSSSSSSSSSSSAFDVDDEDGRTMVLMEFPTGRYASDASKRKREQNNAGYMMHSQHFPERIRKKKTVRSSSSRSSDRWGEDIQSSPVTFPTMTYLNPHTLHGSAPIAVSSLLGRVVHVKWISGHSLHLQSSSTAPEKKNDMRMNLSSPPSVVAGSSVVWSSLFTPSIRQFIYEETSPLSSPSKKKDIPEMLESEKRKGRRRNKQIDSYPPYVSTLLCLFRTTDDDAPTDRTAAAAATATATTATAATAAGAETTETRAAAASEITTGGSEDRLTMTEKQDILSSDDMYKDQTTNPHTNKNNNKKNFVSVGGEKGVLESIAGYVKMTYVLGSRTKKGTLQEQLALQLQEKKEKFFFHKKGGFVRIDAELCNVSMSLDPNNLDHDRLYLRFEENCCPQLVLQAVAAETSTTAPPPQEETSSLSWFLQFLRGTPNKEIEKEGEEIEEEEIREHTGRPSSSLLSRLSLAAPWLLNDSKKAGTISSFSSEEEKVEMKKKKKKMMRWKLRESDRVQTVESCFCGPGTVVTVTPLNRSSSRVVTRDYRRFSQSPFYNNAYVLPVADAIDDEGLRTLAGALSILPAPGATAAWPVSHSLYVRREISSEKEEKKKGDRVFEYEGSGKTRKHDSLHTTHPMTMTTVGTEKNVTHTGEGQLGEARDRDDATNAFYSSLSEEEGRHNERHNNDFHSNKHRHTFNKDSIISPSVLDSTVFLSRLVCGNHRQPSWRERHGIKEEELGVKHHPTRSKGPPAWRKFQVDERLHEEGVSRTQQELSVTAQGAAAAAAHVENIYDKFPTNSGRIIGSVVNHRRDHGQKYIQKFLESFEHGKFEKENDEEESTDTPLIFLPEIYGVFILLMCKTRLFRSVIWELYLSYTVNNMGRAYTLHLHSL